MKTLTLPPYGNKDLASYDYDKLKPFANYYFCDAQNGRWLFFHSSPKLIVVDSFHGSIRELYYDKEYSAFFDNHSCFAFIPHNQYGAWITSEENPETDQAKVGLYLLTFDYENKSVNVQKQTDLLNAEIIDEQFPGYKIFFACNQKSLLFVFLKNNPESNDFILLIYKLENVSCKKQPDFIYKGNYKDIGWLWIYLIDKRLYFFDDTKVFTNVCLKSYIDTSDTIYFYDFKKNFKGEIKLENSMGSIEIDEFYHNPIDNQSLVDHSWCARKLTVLFSVKEYIPGFLNGLVMLDLDKCAWQSITLPDICKTTENPLRMNINEGIIILTNTHVRNPAILYSNFFKDKYFVNKKANRHKEKSYVYRMAFGCPEKLADLVYLFALDRFPNTMKQLQELKESGKEY